MRLLTAAVPPEGDDEFCYTVPGEIVYVTPECDAQRYHPRPACACGCDRAFAGFTSKRGTTAAVVADLDLDRSTLLDILLQHLVDLTDGDESTRLDPELVEQGEAYLTQLIKAGETWPVGTRVRRRRDTFSTL